MPRGALQGLSIGFCCSLQFIQLKQRIAPVVQGFGEQFLAVHLGKCLNRLLIQPGAVETDSPAPGILEQFGGFAVIPLLKVRHCKLLLIPEQIRMCAGHTQQQNQ